MKITSTQIVIVSLIIIIILFLFLYPLKPKQIITPVYYQVPNKRHILNRRRNSRQKFPRHKPQYKPGKDWHVGKNGKYLPADKGGVVPIEPF